MATILVADSDSTTRRIFSYILQNDGHAVTTVVDGLRAVQRLTEFSFDLLLADMSLPRMDGLALLRRARSDERWGKLPIVMFSNGWHAQDRMRAAHAGADAFLSKPVSSQELLRVVNRLAVARRPEEISGAALVLPARSMSRTSR